MKYYLWSCVIFLAIQAQAQAPQVKTYAVNTTLEGQADFRHLEAASRGAIVASDGNFYFGAASLDRTRGAAFFKFDPRTNTLSALSPNLNLFLQEEVSQNIPQGQIATDIIEFEGWLYFATRFSRSEEVDVYPGSHIIAYELESGTIRDFGVIKPHFAIYANLVLDPDQRALYALATPGPSGGSHLFRISLAHALVEDLGVVSAVGESSPVLLRDAYAELWFMPLSIEEKGALPALILKHYRRNGSIEEIAYLNRPSNRWAWLEPHPDGLNAVLIRGRPGGNYTLDYFDPATRVIEKKLDITGASNLFFTPSRRELFYTIGSAAGGERLMSVTLNQDPPQLFNHGQIRDQQQRRALRIGGAAATERGKLFMLGEWSLTSGDVAVLREGQTEKSGLRLAVVELPARGAPSISSIVDQSILINERGSQITFTISDAQTAANELVMTATSSNPELVPPGNIVFGGSGALRSLVINPVANQSGSATITVRVHDAENNSASESFLFSVLAKS
jgi:hypothetical protein